MDNRPIGIYDSGVGGVAVLRSIQHILPSERYILFADFCNAPYGEKKKGEILSLARQGVSKLAKKDVKAVVVACNTATSAAIGELRKENKIPIIGMEPAIKPASEKTKHGVALVLATPATLKLMKFKKLSESLGSESIVPVSCPGLSRMIETEKPGSSKIRQYLKEVLAAHLNQEISAVVIGCTHFSFIEKDIKEAAGCDVVFDGRHGTARHLRQTLFDEDSIGAAEMTDTEFVFDGCSQDDISLILDFMDRPLSFEG